MEGQSNTKMRQEDEMIRDDGRRRSRKMRGRQERGSGRWQGKKNM